MQVNIQGKSRLAFQILTDLSPVMQIIVTKKVDAGGEGKLAKERILYRCFDDISDSKQMYKWQNFHV